MVQGTRDDDDHGALLLFSSDDLSHWQYRYALRTKEPLGYMWECPDLFVLDGQHLLITCPQGVPTQGADYANVHSCVWMQLSHTLADGLTVETVHQLDRGFDFYAPQSFADEQGRRILIGWMGIPDADYTNPTTDHGWQHALTIPRLLSWKDGMLHWKACAGKAGRWTSKRSTHAVSMKNVMSWNCSWMAVSSSLCR